MATINKRVDQDGKMRFLVIVRLKGHPTQTATFLRITDAKKWAQQTEAAIREGRYFKTIEAKKHSLGDMVDRYIDLFNPPNYKRAHLEWWKLFLGRYLLCDITPAMIASGRDELLQGMTKRGTQRSPSTAVRYIAAISHVFTIGIKEFGWIESSPVSKITKPREPGGRVRFLSDEERGRLLYACKHSYNPFLYIVVVLALSSGMRLSEIMNLSWQKVDLQRKQIVLEKTKNKTHRTIPLASLALELLQQHLRERQLHSHLLFPGKIISSVNLLFMVHALLG
jgi:integrase